LTRLDLSIRIPSVTKYKFEYKLRGRAEQFISALKRAGLSGAIIENSFREYAVKVSVSREENDLGAAVLYYKPKSDTFSMSVHELKDSSVAALVEDCWHEQQNVAGQPGDGYAIYVDGSFSNGSTGYGAVILRDGKVVDELFGTVDAEKVAGTYQIAGELAAVEEALKWCREHSVNEVSIYYDYLGIEKWATGRWKTNQPLTKEYARIIRDCPVEIHWHKVDSHTGNRWNDRADALAKKGAGSLQLAADGSDLVTELLETTDAWIEYLMVRGIEACFDRIFNEQFARILIVREEEAVGTFDLYNTKKKRLSPYLHNFRDDPLRQQIESWWKEFLASTVS